MVNEKTPQVSSFTLIVAFICVALAGLAFIPLLPVKLAPSHTLPRLSVDFSMPGNSSRIIEMEVTSKLEAMLARIKGIKGINSTSGNGWGSITLEFDKHTNVDAARFEASTIIRQTWPQLPAETSYPSISMNRPDERSSRPFLSYTINAAATPIVIQRLAEEKIKPRLAQIPGIYRIDVGGATPMEWRLEYDNDQLIRLGIDINDIQTAITQYYQKEFLGIGNRVAADGSTAWIRLTLVPEGEREGRFEPAEITVKNKDGKLIRLDQLLQVSHVEEKPQSYYRINGLNSIYLAVRANEDVNQLDLSRLIKEEMETIEAELPPGYEIHISTDTTEFIQNELNKVYIRSGLTLLILLLFVILITRNLKYTLLIVISLSVNLAIAVIFYYLLGLEIQLYSLAGITISLNLILDNTIVMTDHMLNRKNRNAFLSILAATLTTIGALAIIFFLNEQIRLTLQDFAAVVIINLAVSLFTALFLVPALIDKLKMTKRRKRHRAATKPAGRFRKIRERLTPKRLAVYFSRYYNLQIKLFFRFRKLAFILLILAFGIPVFMLPEKMEGEGNGAKLYNRIVTKESYKEKVKPWVDKLLGGSLRLFIQKVYNGSYFTRNEEMVLSATASLPNGTTLEQMNHLIQRMEAYLSEFKEIKQFQTSIWNARQARIQVTFTKASEKSGFPYVLKSKIIGKAIELGGGSWEVYGLQDQGFNNTVREHAGNYRIEMYGYNYDDLYYWAEQLKERLLGYRRIKEVLINSEFSYWKDDYEEFYFDLDKGRIAEENLVPYQLFSSIRPIFGKNMYAGSIVVDNEQESLRLSSRQSDEYDIWRMQNMPLTISGKLYKLSQFATVEKGQMPQQVSKVNQQYRLCLQYEYIGAGNQGSKILERELKAFNKLLPVGYSAESAGGYWSWGKKENRQYLLLLLIVVIIFFTTSILFNSLKQPLAVIFVIPISYIGVFLTFYWFKLNFDEGGFASFVLLCGITVNASIYVLNEFNQIRIRRPHMPPLHAYIKAWNAKILPIFLTVVSTILGFIPFMLGENKEAFWFPLAAGTIGGLVMSVVGIFFFLPTFALKKKNIPALRFRKKKE